MHPCPVQLGASPQQLRLLYCMHGDAAILNHSIGERIMKIDHIHSSHYEQLTRDNAILLIVDHQVGLYTGVRDIDILQLKHNIVGLTKAAQALKIPVIVTTTTERMWGPMIPELQEALASIQRIQRTTVNAWD